MLFSNFLLRRHMDQRVIKAIEQIKGAVQPVTLTLSWSNLEEKDAIAPSDLTDLSDAIKVAQHPVALNLEYNNIGDEGAITLAEAIKVAIQPLTLNLAYNNIGAEGAKTLAEAIKAAQHPVTLNLNCNKIGAAGAKTLAEAIKAAQHPVTLNLNCNKIKTEGAIALADAIKAATVPVMLNLTNNDIKSEGAKQLGDAIKAAQVPVSLNLTNNDIKSEGAKQLGDAIKAAQVPVSLNLSINNIKTEGAKALAEAIKVAQHPVTLDLGYNQINTEGATALAEAYQINSKLSIKYLPQFINNLEFTNLLEALGKYTTNRSNAAQAIKNIFYPPFLGETIKAGDMLETFFKKSNLPFLPSEIWQIVLNNLPGDNKKVFLQNIFELRKNAAKKLFSTDEEPKIIEIDSDSYNDDSARTSDGSSEKTEATSSTNDDAPGTDHDGEKAKYNSASQDDNVTNSSTISNTLMNTDEPEELVLVDTKYPKEPETREAEEEYHEAVIEMHETINKDSSNDTRWHEDVYEIVEYTDILPLDSMPQMKVLGSVNMLSLSNSPLIN